MMKRRYWLYSAEGRLLGGEWLDEEQVDSINRSGRKAVLVSGDGR